MEEPRCIVLLGGTGSGKSSLANTIFQDNVFEVNDGPNSAKSLCVCKDKYVNNRQLYLIDTADFLDPETNDSNHEMLKCLFKYAPGPHAPLLVLKVEKSTWYYCTMLTVIICGYLNFIIKHFSEDALKYTTIVFTHGEDLPENVRIEDWAQQNDALWFLVQKCGGRCHVFDNEHWNNNQDLDRNNQHQVTELLRTINEKAKRNGDECYMNETLEKLEEQIQKEMKRIRAAPGNKQVPKQQVRARAKENIKRAGWSVTAAIKYTGMVVIGGVGVVGLYKNHQDVAKLAWKVCSWLWNHNHVK